MSSLSVDARLTIANMTTEWGALRYVESQLLRLFFRLANQIARNNLMPRSNSADLLCWKC